MLFCYAKSLVKYTRRVVKEIAMTKKSIAVEPVKDKTTAADPRAFLFTALAKSRSTGELSDIGTVWKVLARASDEIIFCGEQYLPAFKKGMFACVETVQKAVKKDTGEAVSIDVNFPRLTDGIRLGLK